MNEQTALLTHFDKYGFSEVVCGFVEPSSTFNPTKRLFCLGDGRSVDVLEKHLIEINLSDAEKKKLFPLCY